MNDGIPDLGIDPFRPTPVTYAPFVCVKCKEEGNQNGRLVFSNETSPAVCRYHKTPLTKVER